MRNRSDSANTSNALGAFYGVDTETANIQKALGALDSCEPVVRARSSRAYGFGLRRPHLALSFLQAQPCSRGLRHALAVAATKPPQIRRVRAESRVLTAPQPRGGWPGARFIGRPGEGQGCSGVPSWRNERASGGRTLPGDVSTGAGGEERSEPRSGRAPGGLSRFQEQW